MSSVLTARLQHQRLSGTARATPRQLVSWLGAVQAQDFAGAAWALALRTRGLTLADVEDALAAGEILRTHVLRPTWHFVPPDDIRWMLELTGPRIQRMLRTADTRLSLDVRTYARSRTIIERALQGGRQLTRAELAQALARKGIEAAGMRLAHLVAHAELDAVICSGARRGAQFTYGLVTDRAPAARRLARDEALAELARRYFQSHGPATVRDFAWWSGLRMADIRQGIADAGVQALVLDKPPTLDRAPGSDFLLPNYDEYLIAYRDRGAVLEPNRVSPIGGSASPYPHQVVLDGRVAGSWRRPQMTQKLQKPQMTQKPQKPQKPQMTQKPQMVQMSQTGRLERPARVAVRLYDKPKRRQLEALTAQARRFGRFLGMACTLEC